MPVAASSNPVSAPPLLAVRRLSVRYPVAPAWPWQRPLALRAVEEVNFNLEAGETLAIVGESGCGKSTLARALAGLQPVSGGGIDYAGRNLAKLDEDAWRALRREIQVVFQDPLASLDPRMNIAASVEEPLRALCPEMNAAARGARVGELLRRVGLDESLCGRYPHELSGGQCQRAGIARALAVRPKILICDEAVSALDVSVQAQIVNLLMQLRAEEGLSMIFIAHDLALVRHLADRVLVMYHGRVMEQASAQELFARPAHPYTKSLLASMPGANGVNMAAAVALDGELPSALHPPAGCSFAARCGMADEQCTRARPHYRRLAGGTVAACHYL